MATSSANFLASSANSSNGGVVVWEWFENNGSWQPYESDVVAFIEDSYVKGASIVNLGKINPNLSLYNVIFSSTSYQIRLDTGNRRHVRRQIYQMTSPDLNKISWQWAGDYVGQWNSYSFEVASMIETVYSGQQTNFIDLSQTQFKIPYFIDLKNFQQVRIETGTARSIRREKLTVPFPITNGTSIQQPQTFQPSVLIPTSMASLLGHSSQPSSSYQHLSQVTSALYSMSALAPSSNSMSAHASQVASSSNSMSAHASQVASSSNSMSGHASQVGPSSNSMSAHASQVGPCSNSMSAHASQVAPSSNSMFAHASQVAPSSNSMSAHASQIAPCSNSMSGHASQVGPSSNSMSAHASQVTSSSNSMSAHTTQVTSSSNSMSTHASQVSQGSSSSLGKHRHYSGDSDGGKLASGVKKAKSVPTSTHSYVQSYVNNLPSISAVSNTMPQITMPQMTMPQMTMPQMTMPPITMPPITPYSSHMMYGNQMTGLITSSPYLNSLGLSSPTFNMTAGPSQQQSTGPLTRQQLQQMMQTSSFGGSLNMPMTPVSSGFTFSNGITVPGLSNNTMMNTIKGHGSKISPVVSNITNVLTSPLVPGAFTPTLGPTPSLQTSTNSWTGSSSKPSSFPTKGHIVLPKLKKSKEKSKSELPNKFLKPVVNPADTEDCCICCEKLNTESGYGNSNHSDGEVVALSLCNHMFHRQCLLAMYNSGPKDGSIQCPNCKKIHGLKLGTCPGGEMEYWTMPESLPGHSDCGSICVRYNIRSGTQGPEHPSPGSRYSTHGFPRVGYLPDNQKGRKVLQLFILAWKRRIMFTIGTSSTSGYQNTVTWNEIHHKTEFGSNNSGHGYPDPNYLDNVLLELAVQGVTEEDLNDP